MADEINELARLVAQRILEQLREGGLQGLIETRQQLEAQIEGAAALGISVGLEADGRVRRPERDSRLPPHRTHRPHASSTGADVLETRATLRDCQQFVAAISQAGGDVPKSLANILSGQSLLTAHSTPTDPGNGHRVGSP